MRRTNFYQGCAWALLMALALFGAGCQRRVFEASIVTVDESGNPLGQVRLAGISKELFTNAEGRARLRRLKHPVVVILSKSGYLDEPVMIGWEDQVDELRVTLLSDLEGRRMAVHAGGDTMLGRRFLDPDAAGAVFATNGGMIQLGDGGVSARAVVSDLAPLFRAADLRMLNLECAVGEFQEDNDSPGKRWILNMFPESLAGLEELGVDVVTVGNNHVRDFLDAGVQSTLDAAAAHGIETVGAGVTQKAAETPLIVECKGKKIGILAYTSVDGNYVNDAYPVDGETKPDTVAAEDEWSWTARSWGWSGGGIDIPVAARRIGSAWREFAAIEDQLDETARAEAWSSIVGIYPELQDWVARRGHGGAAQWDNQRSPAEIAALRERVDLLWVQLHSGFQYAEVPSGSLRTSAYAAIDAGADLVLSHHPHTVQGVEYYQGKLIAWSLGNLVFDQDFLVTFPSAILRTVWEDNRMIQARLIPIALDSYRPVPQADETARLILRQVRDGSASDGTAERGADAQVRGVLPAQDTAPPGHSPAFQSERHTALLLDTTPAETTYPISIPAGRPVALATPGLIWGPLQSSPPARVSVGKSLFAFGGFENDGAGQALEDAAFWNIDSSYKQIVTVPVFEGRHSLKVERVSVNNADVLIRPVARISLVDHRWWQDEMTPADGTASYAVHLAVRATGEADLAKLRLDCYNFDDSDPTIAPQSALVRSADFPLDVRADGQWHELWIDISKDTFASTPSGEEVRAVMMNLIVSPPAVLKTSMWFDAVDFVAWRDAAKQPETWTSLDWVKTADGTALELDVRALQ